METVACDLCGVNDATIVYDWEGWSEPVPPGVNLVSCRRCGLMYLNPRPDRNEIGAYYPSEYTAYRPAIEDESFGLMRWIRRRKLQRRRQLIERYSGAQAGRVLDVGCATGLFLHEMAASGWRAEGVEPSERAADYARERLGLEVFQGWLGDAPFQPASFDVVTYWDVLEHTFSPRAELTAAARLLRPGGLLALNVPNWHSFDRRLFGRYWSGYDPPRHLYVFKRPALAQLLRDTGFEPVAWLSFMPSYWGFTYSVDFWLGAEAPVLTRPVHAILNLPGMRLPFEPWFSLLNRLGLGDGSAVFAHKKVEGVDSV